MCNIKRKELIINCTFNHVIKVSYLNVKYTYSISFICLYVEEGRTMKKTFLFFHIILYMYKVCN